MSRFLKDNWKWIVFSVIFLVLVHFLFSIPAPYPWLVSVWEAGDFISFIGTVCLGCIATWQTNEANKLSKKMMELELEKEKPFIDIRSISRDELRKYDIVNALKATITNEPVYWGNDWDSDIYDFDDTLIFAIKNLRDRDLLKIGLRTVKISLNIDNEKKNIQKSGASVSIFIDTIPPGGMIPFVLAIPYISWVKLATSSAKQKNLEIQFEFELKNHLGVRYIETIAINIINVYLDNILSPVMLDKTFFGLTILDE